MQNNFASTIANPCNPGTIVFGVIDGKPFSTEIWEGKNAEVNFYKLQALQCKQLMEMMEAYIWAKEQYAE
jgi:hypothetical protein